MSGGSGRIGAERSYPDRGRGLRRADAPDTRHGGAGRRARVYGGESGNPSSREVSVKVQRYGVTDIIVASP